MGWPQVRVEDITGRWRPLADAEAAVAEKRIDDASAELNLQLRRRGMIDPPPDTDVDWVTLYVSVVVEMVRRYLLNPDAWLEETEQLDDYSRTRRRDKVASSGGIYVDDAELDKLLPRAARTAFTIRPGLT